jgi:hypothetical protein
LLSKTTSGSKTVKTYDRNLKTPYQRLMESSIPQELKDRLTTTRALYNPVHLQQNVHRAIYSYPYPAPHQPHWLACRAA